MNASEKVLIELNEREAKRLAELEKRKKNVLKQTIVEGVYTRYNGTTKDEFALMNSILEDVDLTDKAQVLGITNKVLSLPLNEQIHFLESVMEHYYTLSEDTDINENFGMFLARFLTVLVLDVTYYKDEHNKVKSKPNVVTVEDTKAYKITKLEEELGIKIVEDNDRWFDNDGEESIY
jgi:hypothetical protein